MKNLKILFSVLALAVIASSCSSDSDNSTKVKYQIVDIDNSITQIKYKKGDGSTVTLTDYADFAGGGDSKTISVNDLPFTASMEVTAQNTTSQTKIYTLAIYVDGEGVDLQGMSVPPNATSTGVIDFVVQSE